MAVVFVLLVLSADPKPIDLGALSLERARVLDGKAVTVSLLVQKPPYTLLGRTMVGTADRDDGAERGAVLLGRRPDVREGERVTVRGRLRLLRHAPDTVNGAAVPSWWEVRVEESRDR
ncbi:unnamed protein product [Gemmataceae bacterium]|nr:unnamed protein product [Gemmataceae bacterium]VTT98984.1 unnamed protein product [Gemmataceae bacterium]